MGLKAIKAIADCVKNGYFVMDLSEELTGNDEHVTFDLVDLVKTVIEQIRKKINCTLEKIGNIIGDGELRHVYQKFRSDVESLLKNDALKCLYVNGTIEKLK